MMVHMVLCLNIELAMNIRHHEVKAGTCGYQCMHINAVPLDRQLVKPGTVSSATPVIVPDHCMICLRGLRPGNAIVYACGHGVHRECRENENVDHTNCCVCSFPLFQVS